MARRQGESPNIHYIEAPNPENHISSEILSFLIDRRRYKNLQIRYRWISSFDQKRWIAMKKLLGFRINFIRNKRSNLILCILTNISVNSQAIVNFIRSSCFQRWSRGHKARGQGQGHKKNPRPRSSTAFPRTDTLEAKDRNAQGQGPRTQAQVLTKKKKKVFTKIFQAISKKKGLHKNFSSDLHKKTFSKKFFKRYTKF